MTEIHSKHAVVSKAPSELYMVFTDLRNLVQFLPEDKKDDVTADFDSISARVQGFNIGIKVLERTPYSKILYGDSGAPFKFSALFHYEDAPRVKVEGRHGQTGGHPCGRFRRPDAGRI